VRELIEALDSLVEARLQLGASKVDKKGSESLRGMKLRAKNDGSMEGAIVSAAHYAKMQNRTMYAYSGNSFGHAVWRVTYKPGEYLDPINNTGSKVVSVDPDLTMKWADVRR